MKKVVQKDGKYAGKLKEDIIKYSKAKPGVTMDYKEEWGWDRLMVGEKLFLSLAKIGDERPVVTLKLAPEHGDLLRRQYPDQVIPGYYMNKEHWNTIYLDLSWEMEFLAGLIDEAYRLVFSSLTKKRQKEIIEISDLENRETTSS